MTKQEFERYIKEVTSHLQHRHEYLCMLLEYSISEFAAKKFQIEFTEKYKPEDRMLGENWFGACWNNARGWQKRKEVLKEFLNEALKNEWYLEF